uniref:Uncharacterized protein n=1 Tax=Oryza punctata TaxID=4537 RepID=A0A0E0JS38_ORYPU
MLCCSGSTIARRCSSFADGRSVTLELRQMAAPPRLSSVADRATPRRSISAGRPRRSSSVTGSAAVNTTLATPLRSSSAACCVSELERCQRSCCHAQPPQLDTLSLEVPPCSNHSHSLLLLTPATNLVEQLSS